MTAFVRDMGNVGGCISKNNCATTPGCEIDLEHRNNKKYKGPLLSKNLPVNTVDQDAELIGLLVQKDGTLAASIKKQSNCGTSSTAASVCQAPHNEERLYRYRRTRAKGMQTLRLMRRAIAADPLCALLDETEVDAIAQAMDYFLVPGGEQVVQEGESGNMFFVAHSGRLEVSKEGTLVGEVGRGMAFGAIALVHKCPRTATVTTGEYTGLWGASGELLRNAQTDSRKRGQKEVRKFLDSVPLLAALPPRDKDDICDVATLHRVEPGVAVVHEGDAGNCLYIVKSAELVVQKGPEKEEVARLNVGDCFGERALLYSEPRFATVVNLSQSCELLCLTADHLKTVLGADFSAYLERNILLMSMQKSCMLSQFSRKQQMSMVEHMCVLCYRRGMQIIEKPVFAVVLDGEIEGSRGNSPIAIKRWGAYEDLTWFEGRVKDFPQIFFTCSESLKRTSKEDVISAGRCEVRLAVLTGNEFTRALGLDNFTVDPATQTEDYARKIAVVSKVPVFRYLSPRQADSLVRAFELKRFPCGAKVIEERKVGHTFYVVSSGEVKVTIKDKLVRVLGKNAYFGERALLFNELRAATIEVTSHEAELWCVSNDTFHQLMNAKMQKELRNRIYLQDTTVELKELKHLHLLGEGSQGVVRLVQHTRTNVMYALKRIKKDAGILPREVSEEVEILQSNYHPFMLFLVKTFDTPKCLYILTEYLVGGELLDAMHELSPFSRKHAQFYGGSLVLVLDALADQNIIHRDLKPENVMLDSQGYIKLIDMGVSKRLAPEQSRTYTTVGTLYYMAPEIITGRGYGIAADLWSLGVMLYEFVVGALPFANGVDNYNEVCQAVLHSRLTFPTHFSDQLCQHLIMGLLDRNPRKRLGAGVGGLEEIKGTGFFKEGHRNPKMGSLFTRLLSRDLDPPMIPKAKAPAQRADDMDLSDMEELYMEGGSPKLQSARSTDELELKRETTKDSFDSFKASIDGLVGTRNCLGDAVDPAPSGSSGGGTDRSSKTGTATDKRLRQGSPSEDSAQRWTLGSNAEPEVQRENSVTQSMPGRSESKAAKLDNNGRCDSTTASICSVPGSRLESTNPSESAFRADWGLRRESTVGSEPRRESTGPRRESTAPSAFSVGMNREGTTSSLPESTTMGSVKSARPSTFTPRVSQKAQQHVSRCADGAYYVYDPGLLHNPVIHEIVKEGPKEHWKPDREFTPRLEPHELVDKTPREVCLQKAMLFTDCIRDKGQRHCRF